MWLLDQRNETKNITTRARPPTNKKLAGPLLGLSPRIMPILMSEEASRGHLESYFSKKRYQKSQCRLGLLLFLFVTLIRCEFQKSQIFATSGIFPFTPPADSSLALSPSIVFYMPLRSSFGCARKGSAAGSAFARRRRAGGSSSLRTPHPPAAVAGRARRPACRPLGIKNLLFGKSNPDSISPKKLLAISKLLLRMRILKKKNFHNQNLLEID